MLVATIATTYGIAYLELLTTQVTDRHNESYLLNRLQFSVQRVIFYLWPNFTNSAYGTMQNFNK